MDFEYRKIEGKLFSFSRGALMNESIDQGRFNEYTYYGKIVTIAVMVKQYMLRRKNGSNAAMVIETYCAVTDAIKMLIVDFASTKPFDYQNEFSDIRKDLFLYKAELEKRNLNFVVWEYAASRIFSEIYASLANMLRNGIIFDDVRDKNLVGSKFVTSGDSWSNTRLMQVFQVQTMADLMELLSNEQLLFDNIERVKTSSYLPDYLRQTSNSRDSIACYSDESDWWSAEKVLGDVGKMYDLIRSTENCCSMYDYASSVNAEGETNFDDLSKILDNTDVVFLNFVANSLVAAGKLITMMSAHTAQKEAARLYKEKITRIIKEL